MEVVIRMVEQQLTGVRRLTPVLGKHRAHDVTATTNAATSAVCADFRVIRSVPPYVPQMMIAPSFEPIQGLMSCTAPAWKKMESVLAYDYKKSPKKALKEVQKLLVKYDTLDEKEALIEERMQLELEENGPKSRKLKKLRAELKDVQKERAALQKKEAKHMDLGLFRKKVEKDVVVSNLTGEEIEALNQN